MKCSTLLRWLALVLMLLALAGCGIRSISNSSYPGPYTSNPLYFGELSEFDVLGISRTQTITDEEIQRAFAAKQPLSIKPGSTLMLIQSGALFPDEQMARAFAEHYVVGLFSGVPERDPSGELDSAGPAAPYSMALRLVAARGGYEKIVVYWGILETAQENLDTKAVSWVPIVGNAIRDESQRMRIRLKLAMIGVQTGQWEMFAPDPHEDEAISSENTRIAIDQTQVNRLKETAYRAAVDEILARYAG